MLTIEEARTRVARGAAHLDQIRPGWHDQIDVGTLTLHDQCGCIVGQLEHVRDDVFPDYARAAAALSLFHENGLSRAFNLHPEPGADEFIRGGGTYEQWYRPLQDAWIEAIAARRVPVEEPVAVQAR